MGPDEYSLDLARKLIKEFNLSCDPYSMAYSIMAWCDAQEAKEQEGTK